MATRTASHNAGAERFKRRKSAFSLADKWFCFRGMLSSQRARLAAAITAASGQIFAPPTAVPSVNSNSNSTPVVYVITDYWVDTLLLTSQHQHAADGVAFVAVTEFWLREMLRTQEWLDIDAHVFFMPPPRPKGAELTNQRLLSYPENYTRNQEYEDANGGPQKLLMNLPCSPENKWRDQVPFWPYFVVYLNFPMRNTRDLATVLNCITGTEARRSLTSLEIAVNDMLSAEQRFLFFKKVLPEMARLVLNLPTMFAQRPEVLGPFFENPQDDNSLEGAHSSRLRERSVTFTKREALALVSACFFCVFPSQNRVVSKKQKAQDSEEQYTEGEDDEEVDFPFFTMRTLFISAQHGGGADLKAQKIRCVLQYFLRVVPLLSSDDGADRNRLDNEVITFTRVAVSLSAAKTKKSLEMTPQDLLDSLNLANNSALTMGDVRCESDHLIEDLDNHLQIDFANKYAGGGVFNSGCVQEEIRFLLSPELFIACLVFAKLEPNESFVIHGTERYCLYGGYGSNFFYKGKYEDKTEFDVLAGGEVTKRRRKCVIVGIDAVDYGSFAVGRQYTRVHIWRDLVKAFVGFAYPAQEAMHWPVATGNWGCGVFRGDAELKFLIQWLAASLAGRNLVYVLFERDQELHESILELLELFEGVKEESEKQRIPHLVAQFLLSLDELLSRRLNAMRSAGKRAVRPSVLALARGFLDTQLQGLKRLKLSSPSDSHSPPQKSENEVMKNDVVAENEKKRSPVSSAKPSTEASESPTQQHKQSEEKQAMPGTPPPAPPPPQKKPTPEGKGLQQRSIHDFFAKK